MIKGWKNNKEIEHQSMEFNFQIKLKSFPMFKLGDRG